MALTPQEREEVKREHLRLLQQKEEERKLEAPPEPRPAHPPSQADPERERFLREVEISRLQGEIEAEFYQKLGHKRYVDHRGKVLWLTQEEFDARLARKRRNRNQSAGDVMVEKRLITVFTYLAVALLALAAGYFLAR